MFHGRSSLRKFSKKSKSFPKTCFQKFFIPKMPKIVPKSVQTCFEHVFGCFFRKNFLPSVPWRVESSKIFKKIKNFSKFQSKFFKIKKIFKNPKMPKIVPKSVQTCFEHVFGCFFRKKTFAQCSMEGRVFEIFKKIKKFSKIQKCPKSFPKVSKRVLNMFSGVFFENKTFAQCSMEGRVFEIFQKIKNFQKSKNAQNRSQKCPNVF